MKLLIFLLMSMSLQFNAFASDSASYKQSQIMQDFAENILKHRAPPWGVTAISMSAQCKDKANIYLWWIYIG